MRLWATPAASDLTRALRTAELIGEGRNWGEVHVLAGLRERDVGEFTGHPVVAGPRRAGDLEP